MPKRFFNLFVLLSVFASFLSTAVVRAAVPGESYQATRQFWDIQRVDDMHKLTEKMGDHAAVYGADGTLNVAYGDDHLYYARCVGVDCTVEVVDAADYVGMYASLALDRQGYPHIAYYDLGKMDTCDDEKVKYAAWNGSQWRIEVVDQGCLGDYPSIALDAQDVPHISYFDMVSDNLMLADREGTAWHAYTPYWLPSFGFSGYPSSLLSDAQGRLHLAFIAGDAGGSGKVWYTRKVGDAWEPLVAVDSQPGASRLAMALDSTGNPHLAYNHRHFDAGLSATVNTLRYKRFDGSAWLAPEEVAKMEYLGWVSVMIKIDGYPRLAYKVDGSVATVNKTSSGWGAPAAVPNTDGAERMYLWQSSSANVLIGLTYYAGGQLKTVRFHGPPLLNWSAPFEIDSTGVTGNHIAMVTSAAGDLHVVYTDGAEKKLRYAHRPAGGAWQIETVLEAGDNLLIRAADIDLDSNNRQQIVYQEYNDIDQRSTLKYLSWSGNAWVNWGAVHQAAHNGCAPSLALDASNTIYIAYNDCDYVHDNLTLAIYDGAWHYQAVDPEENTSSASLSVNDMGVIYISYSVYNYAYSQVRFAKKEGAANWSIENAASATAIINTSLAFDSTGKPWIAYISDNYPDYNAKLVHWDGQRWWDNMVTTIAYQTEASLAIDGQDRLHLAYPCWSNLCYATNDGSGWTITDPVDRPPADPDDDYGTTRNVAIGLGSQGLPVIVYDGELDLKIAEMKEQMLVFLPLVMR